MLTISKPLSAGQAQSYHQKEYSEGAELLVATRRRVPASGKVVSQHTWGLPVRFRLRILLSSARASTRRQANSLFASERRTNTRMQTGRPSRRWSIAPVGTQLSPLRNLFL